MSKNILSVEKNRLAAIAKTFSMRTGFNGRLEKYRIMTIRSILKNGRVLDVGCADGLMAMGLAQNIDFITAIDGSQELVDRARQLELKNVEFICTLFEEFRPQKKFDSIILSDILEHIDNPRHLLSLSKEWVKDDGVICILCPNAGSIHRRVGVLAGMLNNVYDLNETDLRVGHRRVYDMELLTQEVSHHGLRVLKYGGMFLKPLSNDQMDQLPDAVVDAFYEIGRGLPCNLLAEIYVQCAK